MNKIINYVPVVIFLVFYLIISLICGFSSINIFGWANVVLLFISAILLSSNKWWGCIFGIIVSTIFICIGTVYNGQVMSEAPIGIVLFIFYIVSGINTYRIR